MRYVWLNYFPPPLCYNSSSAYAEQIVGVVLLWMIKTRRVPLKSSIVGVFFCTDPKLLNDTVGSAIKKWSLSGTAEIINQTLFKSDKNQRIKKSYYSGKCRLLKNEFSPSDSKYSQQFRLRLKELLVTECFHGCM